MQGLEEILEVLLAQLTAVTLQECLKCTPMLGYGL